MFVLPQVNQFNWKYPNSFLNNVLQFSVNKLYENITQVEESNCIWRKWGLM